MITYKIVNKGMFFSIRTTTFDDGTNTVWLYKYGAPISNLTQMEFDELALLMSTTVCPVAD